MPNQTHLMVAYLTICTMQNASEFQYMIDTYHYGAVFLFCCSD